ncbi:unnamed protein product [Lactuca saligna]|uniref:Uncharacterized protein n=1 Tax=Lactuca saligna TaxID=75948 RepID=A0AA36E6Y6_LACSI|nr:unnamed protein product [Lactuca saligna]
MKIMVVLSNRKNRNMVVVVWNGQGWVCCVHRTVHWGKCEKLYYYQLDIDLPKGLALICNDPDYYDFIAIAYECCVILPMYVNHFRNSNIQEWLDEHKDNFVGNVEEEVLDGAGLVKEVAPGHRDVGDTKDEEENDNDNDDEDEDVDDAEDDHQKPHFL